MFENRVLWRIFGPKRASEQESGENYLEDLNDLYCSPNIVWVMKSRKMRWAWHVKRMGERRGVCRVFAGKPKGKRPLRIPRRRWEDNINMDLQEVGCRGVD